VGETCVYVQRPEGGAPMWARLKPRPLRWISIVCCAVSGRSDVEDDRGWWDFRAAAIVPTFCAHRRGYVCAPAAVRSVLVLPVGAVLAAFPPIRNGTRFAAAPLATLGLPGTLLYREGSAFSGSAALDSSPAAPYLAQLPEQ
jgi:hypothetical protein